MTDLSHAEEFVNGIAALGPDELAHHGVLGQKWGVRKASSETREQRDARYAKNTRNKLAFGTLGASVAIPKAVKAIKAHQASRPKAVKQPKRHDPSDDHVLSRHLSAQPNHTLSNAELQTINTRKQLEKSNKQLDPKGLAKGAAIVGGVLAAGGLANKTIKFVNSPAGTALIKAGKSQYAKIGLKMAETIVAHA